MQTDQPQYFLLCDPMILKLGLDFKCEKQTNDSKGDTVIFSEERARRNGLEIALRRWQSDLKRHFGHWVILWVSNAKTREQRREEPAPAYLWGEEEGGTHTCTPGGRRGGGNPHLHTWRGKRREELTPAHLERKLTPSSLRSEQLPTALPSAAPGSDQPGRTLCSRLSK